MPRLALAVLALFALVFVPVVDAQAEPRVQVAIENLPSAPVSTNHTAYVEPFRLRLSVHNVVCSTATDFVFEVTATAESSFWAANGSGNRTTTFSVAPARPSITVPAGQHVSQPFSGEIEPALQVLPSSIPYGGARVNVTVRTSVAPKTTDCQSAGPLTAEAEPKAFTVLFRRGTEDPVLTPAPEMPGPGLVVALAALVGALSFTRGRPGA